MLELKLNYVVGVISMDQSKTVVGIINQDTEIFH